MGLDREAGMEDVLHQDLTTQVWARLGQVWATGREPAQKPPKVTPRTGETTRFPGAEGGNPSGQEEIQMGITTNIILSITVVPVEPEIHTYPSASN